MLRLLPSTISFTPRRFIYGAIKGPIIGVDLGTFNSRAAVMNDHQVNNVVLAGNAQTFPSYVTVKENGKYFVGEEAKRQAILNPLNTLYATKRFIGRKYYAQEIRPFVYSTSYKTEKDKYDADGKVVFDVQGEMYSPPEVASHVLKKLKESVESFLGKSVQNGVMTVPPYFYHSQIKATKKALKMAGLNVIQTIDEPVAAALAYGFSVKNDKTIVVCDFGGATFDVSILHVQDNDFKIKSTNSDLSLGGEDFINSLVQYLVKRFQEEFPFSIKGNPMAEQRIYDAAEKAIFELSTATETNIFLPSICMNDYYGSKHMDVTIRRKQFEMLSEDLLQRIKEPCKKVLADAELKPYDIDEVLLVGGMSYMPKVQTIVEEIFGRKPNTSVNNPEAAVVMGAAVQGYDLIGQSSHEIKMKEHKKWMEDLDKESQKTWKDIRRKT